MHYVIYNIETTLIVPTGKNNTDYHQSERLAKAALTRYLKHPKERYGTKREQFAIADYESFKKIEKMEERTGIVGAAGRKYIVPVNTPWTSGPWSETYWSS